MTRREIAVVSAGLSQPSSTRLLAEQLEAATAGALRQQGVEPRTEVIELRDHAHDIANNLVAGFPTGSLQSAIETVTRADGLIVVTPVFNASYSGLFKSFFDILAMESLTGKPVLIAASGGSARHSLVLEHALRPLFAYLQTVVVPTAVFAASEDWGTGESEAGALRRRIEQAAQELATLVRSREVPGPIDPFDDVTPFERLLDGD